MQYLCLFWGSNNYMYTNCCQYSESSSTPTFHAPRAPCRSFCIQVTTLVASASAILFITRMCDL